MFASKHILLQSSLSCKSLCCRDMHSTDGHSVQNVHPQNMHLSVKCFSVGLFTNHTVTCACHYLRVPCHCHTLDNETVEFYTD